MRALTRLPQGLLPRRLASAHADARHNARMNIV